MGANAEVDAARGDANAIREEDYVNLVSFPDPAFKLDKDLAYFARNLGLPDLAW